MIRQCLIDEARPHSVGIQAAPDPDNPQSLQVAIQATFALQIKGMGVGTFQVNDPGSWSDDTLQAARQLLWLMQRDAEKPLDRSQVGSDPPTVLGAKTPDTSRGYVHYPEG